MNVKIVLISILITIFANSMELSQTPQAKAFASMMHKKYGFSEAYIINTLKKAHFREDILARYRGKHRVGSTDFSWSRYKHKILIPESVELGKRFMHKYKKWLNIASKKYKVSPEIITAFIRVESKFGLYGDEYRVIDALATLGLFKNRKYRFFKSELEKLFILAKKRHLNILKLRGSFAGAMGCVQQVPSIQLRYGIDLDGNGRADPNSMIDCIGSIAYFLHINGWRDSLPPIIEAKVKGDGFKRLKSGYKSLYPLYILKRYGITPTKDIALKKAYFIRLRDGKRYDIYLGTRNYRIITLYNASKRYAVTIALYEKAIAK